jgi:hypothetical protein
VNKTNNPRPSRASFWSSGGEYLSRTTPGLSGRRTVSRFVLPVNSCAASGYPGWVFDVGGAVDMLRITRGRGRPRALHAVRRWYPPKTDAPALRITPTACASTAMAYREMQDAARNLPICMPTDPKGLVDLLMYMEKTSACYRTRSRTAPANRWLSTCSARCGSLFGR